MRLKWYGWAGLGVVVVAEICLFARQSFVARWFTPIVWTGYVLFTDALASLLVFIVAQYFNTECRIQYRTCQQGVGEYNSF